MLLKTLFAAMEHAKTPRGVRLASWALEKATGLQIKDLIQQLESKQYVQTVGSFATTDNLAERDWYQQNGYYGLSSTFGRTSYSGKTVTPDSALETSAVYACVKIIAEDIGSLPFFPYERSEDGETIQKAFGDPLYEALHDMPNPEMSAGEFREALTARALLGMDGFARIERPPNGRLLLWPITDSVRIERNASGQPIYYVREPNGTETPYTQDKIFHLRNVTLDGERGDDMLRRARHIIGLTQSIQEYAGRFFAKDASAGVILERALGAPMWGPEEVEKVKAAWRKYHQSVSMSHEVAVLQEGTKVTRLDPDHQKLQMLELRKLQLLEVCRLFRMPPHKLGDLDRATFSNIEHQAIEYVTHTLRPWFRRWEEAVYRCLLTPEQRKWTNGKPRMYAEFSVEALLRGDFKTQTEGFRALLEKGVYSINEVRAWFNLNPVEGGDGHYIQLNMQQVASDAASAVEQVANTAAEKAARKIAVELLEAKLLPAPQEVTQ